MKNTIVYVNHEVAAASLHAYEMAYNGHDGRRRIDLVDNFTGECVAEAVDKGARARRQLERVARRYQITIVPFLPDVN